MGKCVWNRLRRVGEQMPDAGASGRGWSKMQDDVANKYASGFLVGLKKRARVLAWSMLSTRERIASSRALWGRRRRESKGDERGAKKESTKL